MKDIVNNSKKQIEQLIYQFVYDLTSTRSNSELSKEFAYCIKILSEDKRFMAAVKEIYKDRHKGFERGYEMLRNHELK